MSSGYVMCTRQAAINRKTTKDGLAKERTQKIAEISAKWKDGFKVLKEENDRLQAELLTWYKDAHEACDLTYEQEINACREEFR